MSESSVKRAISRARRDGDFETVEELQDMMKQVIGEEPPITETPQQTGQIQVKAGERTATIKQTGQQLVFRNNQWIDINTGQPI